MRHPLTVMALLSSLVVGCGADGEQGRVIAVPGDHATIQDAVDHARPGDMVLVEPGVYYESVRVGVDGITIRGTDRSRVVLDGEDSRPNGIAVSANGVVIENLSVRRYRQNGVIVSGALAGGDPASGSYGAGDDVVDGYRVSFVTAYDNGLYGVYAFAARNGVIEHSYASGHPDSGFYVGQCRPCNVVVRDVTAEFNAIGYFGTNASENVWVVDSVFRHNRLGIAPNSQRAEQLAPQEGATIAGNLVADNDDPRAPAISSGFFGGGIAVGGGGSNQIVRNRVTGHAWAGIVVMDLTEFSPIGNEVRDNVVTDNAVDLAYLSGGDGRGNCFSGNEFTVSLPADLESSLPCGAPASGDVTANLAPLDAPADPSDMTFDPPAQPSMPDPSDAPFGRATAPTYPDLDAITVPVGG